MHSQVKKYVVLVAAIGGQWLIAHSALGQCASAQTPGQTPGQRVLCAAAAADGDVNTIVSNYGTSSLGLQQLSTQADIQINTVAISSPGAQRADVACLVAARTGAQTSLCTGEEGAPAPPGQESAVQEIGSWGIASTANWTTADQDFADGQTGFDADSPGLVVALDYRIGDRSVIGAAAGFQQTKLDFDFNSGNLDSDVYRALVFFNQALSNAAYIELQAGYGRSSYDSTRICADCAAITRNTASFDGDEYLASAGGGYAHDFSSWNLGAYLRADYLRTKTDAYTETGEALQANRRSALQVDGQSVESFTSVLGAQLSHTTAHNNIEITPRLRLEWVHEFDNGSRVITSRFLDDAGPITAIRLPTASPVSDWVSAGVGIVLASGRKWSIRADYSHLFKSDISADDVAVGFRYSL